MQKAYKLHGKHKHYEWGGSMFIPNLMHVENKEKQPFAEYWMGVHPSAPSIIDTEAGAVDLNSLIQKESINFIGAATQNNFGTLPYLFKVLDVAKMLSIQVHPTKENAIIGFELENKAGIAIDAPNRNYKDKNHKPEVMVALSDFWLLHGFLAPELLDARLQEYFYFHPLLDHFRGVDYQGLYSFFMQLASDDSDRILKPLMMDAVASVKRGEVDKTHPHWWANKYYNGIVPENNIDKGIFSIYILNIVQVAKYQAVFQGAGLLHAYLEGQNIELMANSDNVLRGGLTPKHIDINELIKHVNFVPTFPNVLVGEKINGIETVYPCPVADFGLSKIVIERGKEYTIETKSLEMLLVVEGKIRVEGLDLSSGDVAMIPATQKVQIKAEADALLFKSYVP